MQTEKIWQVFHLWGGHKEREHRANSLAKSPGTEHTNIERLGAELVVVVEGAAQDDVLLAPLCYLILADLEPVRQHSNQALLDPPPLLRHILAVAVPLLQHNSAAALSSVVILCCLFCCRGCEMNWGCMQGSSALLWQSAAAAVPPVLIALCLFCWRCRRRQAG